jgi:transposase
MSAMIHYLVGYDRITEHLTEEYVVPEDILPEAKTLAHVPADDPDVVLCYPLTSAATRDLAGRLKAGVDTARRDYFLEGFVVRVNRVALNRTSVIIEAYRAGKKYREIGAEHGISRQRVCQIIQRHEGRTHPHNSMNPSLTARDYAIVEAYRAGSTQYLIAAEFGLSQPYISKVIMKHEGRASQPRQSRVDRDHVIVEAYHDGKTYREIRAEFGVSHGLMSRALGRHGGDPAIRAMSTAMHRHNHQLRRQMDKVELWKAVRIDYATGLTMREVAAKNGISTSLVHKLLHRMHVRFPPESDKKAHEEVL